MYLFLTALLVLVLDQLSKYYVVTHFRLYESVPVIENVFHWTYILNPGAAFGLMAGSRWIFVAIAAAVLVGIYWLRKDIMEGGWWIQYGTALFAGGAIGNLIDRARQGLVIDFFDFRIWPIFNVADIAICVGVGMIVWKILIVELKKS